MKEQSFHVIFVITKLQCWVTWTSHYVYCEHKAKVKGSLRTHVKIVHKGVKYPCDQYDYQATEKSNLQIHIQYKHDGIKSEEAH